MAVAAAAIAAAAALGAGGTSIAGAPVIRPGAEEVLNTTTDRTVPGTDGSEQTGCWSDFEYWRLSLVAGDDVTFRGRANGASGFLVGVFPAGTTDANIRTTTAIALGKVPNSGPLRFKATSTGTYPVVVGPNCHDGMDGELAFTTTVAHSAVKQKVVATLDHVARIPLSGVVTATVRAPYSGAIHDPNLALKLYGTWRDGTAGAATSQLLATSSPKQGTVRFRYRLPAALSGKTVQLTIGGGGGDYQPVSSPAVTVAVG